MVGGDPVAEDVRPILRNHCIIWEDEPVNDPIMELSTLRISDFLFFRFLPLVFYDDAYSGAVIFYLSFHCLTIFSLTSVCLIPSPFFIIFCLLVFWFCFCLFVLFPGPCLYSK